ncbi:carboxylesterase 1-like isoform X3 [Papaver somniferum]|uniref:carboxylesterase 1-like isoform X3 n=1 Tax=Papaver somniferum TaxID=3469 RepID=UPI000E6FDA11|nr:carboxylesterase 1-like isoform X3 [Papaver somniferum]XP_026380216.1 carboxylesterase 1-like isoform X3 [Papaver somniferum]
MADQSQQQATDKSTVTATRMFDRLHTITTTDPYEKLMCIHNPDNDTLIRNFPNPLTILAEDDQTAKDISLNPDRKTSIRIFRPPAELSVTNKLPIIIYFHGGGFILFNAASTMSHNFCQSIGAHLPALVVSVDYRLAPESRLPAAYDDAVDALNWVKSQALDTSNGEPWFKEYADFSRCFIMGCSAGGNIAYHANLRAVEMDLEPVKINGLILHIPFFGSSKRTESELRLINDLYLAPSLSDVMWELALPVGSDRDHAYCNPSIDDGESSRIKVGLMNRCLVMGFYGDPLIDRQIQLVQMLEENGVKVETCIAEGGFHGVAFHDPKILETLLEKLKQFI